MMNNFEHLAATPLNYLKVFFRRKELIVIPAFIGVVLGICTGILLPKQYKSETIVLVREGKSDNPLFDRLAVSTTVEQRLMGIRESILGWNSLTEVVKRLELDREVESQAGFEGLISGLRKNIKILMRGPNILDLTYVDKDPVTTQAVLKSITDIFIDKNIQAQNKETSEAINFIEEQLHVYLGKIKSAEIAELQERLNILLVDSTSQHPLVQELQALINAKKEALKKDNLEYTEDLGLGQQQTKPMIDEIKKALDTLETQSFGKTSPNASGSEAKVMVNVNLEKVVARDVGVNTEIYNMLLQRLETAKITQRLQSSAEGTYYEIIDPPRVPLKPFKPNKILVALIGLFFGAGLGVGLVFVSEFLDKSFLDVEDAKEFLGVPLFGAISKIHTVESIRRDKERIRWLYGLTVVLGTILIAVALKIASFLN